MEVFNVVAGVASILGLAASLWAVVEVRRLRRRYTRMALLPVWTDHLNDHALRLTALIEGVEDDPSEIRDEVARLDATLEALARLVAQGNKQEVKAVQALIRQTSPLRDKGQVRTIRTGVFRLIKALRLHTEEDQWT